jgi:Asp-tRNA(Asn)/Glu-tRNA(Gln) amidotransferase A subunit family amidase
MATNFAEIPLAKLASKIRTGHYAPSAVVEACLDRIDRRDDALNAFITVFEERARTEAKRREHELETDGEVGPLHGVPVAVKDSRAVAGERFTWGTKLLDDNVADADDILVTRLRDAGAIIVGKTNLPEFALMGGTDNRLVGPTANPFNLEKMVGGSSGGSAAAVAAGLVPVAQGEDGGGSLRMPASTCGIYTIKPTFGRVPEHSPGRIDAFVHSPMQSAGPLARRVEDAALLLDVLAGPHPNDPFALPETTTYREAIDEDIDGFDLALSPNLDLYPIDPDVRERIVSSAKLFEEAGATVEKVNLDFGYSREEITDAFMRQSNVLTTRLGDQLASSYGIDITGTDRNEILPYLVEQFEAGRETSALEYKSADTVRTAVLDTIEELFADYDMLIASTLMVPPFEKSVLRHQPGPSEIDGTRLDDSRWGTLIDWRATQIANMTGHPAASIPAGFVDGVPVGMELIGPRFGESSILAVSRTFEKLRPWQQSYGRIRH